MYVMPYAFPEELCVIGRPGVNTTEERRTKKKKHEMKKITDTS